jgi:hypothetical protein
MLSHTEIQHILLVPLPAYGKKPITGTAGTEFFPGHTRPLCALAGRLVAAGNIVITMLMAPNWVQKAKSDISAQFPAGHEALERIRCVHA